MFAKKISDLDKKVTLVSKGYYIYKKYILHNIQINRKHNTAITMATIILEEKNKQKTDQRGKSYLAWKPR